MQVRVFLALELPSALKKELETVVARYGHRTEKGANWVKPENMHLTLLFIGEMAENRLAEIDEVLQRLLRGFPPFKFSAAGLELFPANNPRLLWLKLDKLNDDIFMLHRRIKRELSSLELEFDHKALRLHITLARLKSALTPELERELMQYDIKNTSLDYNSICLFRSVLSPSGPSYSIIERYNLN